MEKDIMAIFRQIQTSYWQDPFIENLVFEEKSFYLYLMTNPKTSACGCYEITKKFMAFEMGSENEFVEKMIDVFQNKYKKIEYSTETYELLIKNWLTHNPPKSPSTIACIQKELITIKNEVFKKFIMDKITTPPVDTPPTPPIVPPGDIDTRYMIPDRDIEKDTSSLYENQNVGEEEDVFLLKLKSIRNYPFDKIIDADLVESLKALLPSDELLLELVEQWKFTISSEKEFDPEKARHRLRQWVKKYSTPEIAKLKISIEQDNKKSEIRKEYEAITTKEMAICFTLNHFDNNLILHYKIYPEVFEDGWVRELMDKYEITNEELDKRLNEKSS